MMPNEKTQLLALWQHAGSWCRGAEARDANGEAVRFDDSTAVAWDITGALCRLFGWKRACVLFAQLERHLVGKPQVHVGESQPDPGIEAMKNLQDFNDRSETTFETLLEQIKAMPVWSRGE